MYCLSFFDIRLWIIPFVSLKQFFSNLFATLSICLYRKPGESWNVFFTFPEHPSLPLVFFCLSTIAGQFFSWDLYCMSFINLRLVIIPLMSSNFPYRTCIILLHKSSCIRTLNHECKKKERKYWSFLLSICLWSFHGLFIAVILALFSFILELILL